MKSVKLFKSFRFKPIDSQQQDSSRKHSKSNPKKKLKSLQRRSSLEIKTQLFLRPSPQKPISRILLSNFKEKILKNMSANPRRQVFGVQKLQKSRLFSIISSQLINTLIEDQTIGVYYKKVNMERYQIKFGEYLNLLFRTDNFTHMNDLKKIHAFGIRSFYYVLFKITLFKIIFRVEDFFVEVQTIFQGCRRVQKYRLCIATCNQFFLVIPPLDIIKLIQCEFQRELKTVPVSSETLEQLITFLFESNGLEVLSQSLSKVTQLDRDEFLRLKRSLIKVLVSVNELQLNMLQRVIENLKFLKDKLLNRQTLYDFIKRKYAYFKNFQKVLLHNLLPRVTWTKLQQRTALLLFYHIFDLNQYTFSHQEIIQICRIQEDDREFVNSVTKQIVQFMRREEFPEYLFGQVVCELKRFRKMCLKPKFNNQAYQKLHKLLAKNLQIYFISLSSVKRFCSPKVMALWLLEQETYDREELAELHSAVRVSENDLQFFSRQVLKGVGQEQRRLMQGKINKMFVHIFG